MLAKKHQLTPVYILNLLLLSVILLTCNLALVKTSGLSDIFWLLVGYLGLLIIYRQTGLSKSEVGFAKNKLKVGFRVGIAVGLLLLSILTAVYFIQGSDAFKDTRYQKDISATVWSVALVLPLKTVLFEELAFRGVLPALLLRRSSRSLTYILSALAFGLWHLSTSGGIASNNIIGSNEPSQLLITFGVIAFTSLAGFALLWLRFRTDSIITPISVHWLANSGAIIFATLSWN